MKIENVENRNEKNNKNFLLNPTRGGPMEAGYSDGAEKCFSLLCKDYKDCEKDEKGTCLIEYRKSEKFLLLRNMRRR